MPNLQKSYAFGMEMPGRSIGSDFAYNFNGKRTDKWNGDNGSYLDFGARILDTRLGRWFTQDPKKHLYPSESSYNFGLNSPLLFIDPDGGTVTPMPGNAKAKRTWNITKFNSANLTNRTENQRIFESAIKNADESTINYIIDVQEGVGQGLDIQWQNSADNRGQNQTVIIRITVEAGASDAVQYAQAMNEMGKAVHAMNQIEGTQLGFQQITNSNQQLAGLDWSDITDWQIGGKTNAENTIVSLTGSVKDYYDKGGNKMNSSQKQNWVRKYKQNGDRVYRNQLNRTGPDGFRNVLPAYLISMYILIDQMPIGEVWNEQSIQRNRIIDFMHKGIGQNANKNNTNGKRKVQTASNPRY